MAGMVEQRQKSLWLKKGDPAGPDLHSEEADAPQYMEHLGIETVLVDPRRTFMSISGAQIRENPFHIGNIFTEVKPFFVRTVAILAASRVVNPPW